MILVLFVYAAFCVHLAFTESLQCRQGYEPSEAGGEECIDVNECTTGVDKCPAGTFCFNRMGYYSCYNNCPSPWYKIVGGKVCEDFNECTEQDVDPCARYGHHRCVNVQAGYRCKRVSCPKGYRFEEYNNGEGARCIERNECIEQPNICGEKGQCRNLRGSYYCRCDRGYTVDKVSKKCKDFDECSEEKFNYCSHGCTNTPGSYTCSCPSGYKLRPPSNRVCRDVNECAVTPQICNTTSARTGGEIGVCINTVGTYQCIHEPCPNDYYTRTSKNSCRRKRCERDDHACLYEPVSIKFTGYGLHANTPAQGFTYRYKLQGFSPDVNFLFSIVEGNEEHYFDVQTMYDYGGSARCELFNIRKLPASKRFRLKLHADAKRGVQLLSRYVYIFHLFTGSE